MTEINIPIQNIAYQMTSTKMCRNNFYKKHMKDNERELLIMDEPLGNDSNDCLVDTLISTTEPLENFFNDLTCISDNEELTRAITRLTDRQKEILHYVYIQNLTITEVASLLKTTRQVINKTHNLAISNLKKGMGVN